MGPARDVTLDLAKISSTSLFVETGTFKGKTTRWASEHFSRVFTIERAEPFYQRYSPELDRIRNITPLLGDSRQVLPQIIDEIGGQTAMFWLDGHWCGGVTAGDDDECPLIDELKVLANRADDIIMIDDARLFLRAPPLPHNADDWPTLFDIAAVFAQQLDKRYIQIFHDTIFIVPNTKNYVEILREHARRYAESLTA